MLTDGQLEELSLAVLAMDGWRYCDDAVKALSELRERRALDVESCPCTLTTPCHDRCACVLPLSSSGCRRCCSYGSIEQRRAKAEWLAARDLTSEERDALREFRESFGGTQYTPTWKLALHALSKLLGGES